MTSVADYYLMTNSGCRITKTVLDSRAQVFRALKKKFGDHLYLTSSGIEDIHTRNYAFRYDNMITPAATGSYAINYTHSRSPPEQTLQSKLDDVFSFRVLWEVPMIINGIIYRYDFVAYNHNHLVFVEYDGTQHFAMMNIEGETRDHPGLANDIIKTKFILDHKVKMIRICKEDYMLAYSDQTNSFRVTDNFDRIFLTLLQQSDLLAVNSRERYRLLLSAV